MKHVRQRFGVHQAVLDGGFQHELEVRVAFVGMLQRVFDGGIQKLADALVVALDLRAARPVRRQILRQAAADWIDAESEKLVKRWMKGFEAEGRSEEHTSELQ